jgi:hypothetical protein
MHTAITAHTHTHTRTHSLTCTIRGVELQWGAAPAP